MARSSVPMLSFLLLLGACGGGGQDPLAAVPNAPPVAAPPAPPEPQPTVVTGYFKDARVEGLSFHAGAERGITDADGRFTCEPAGDVEFSIGAVTLGRSACDTVVTPLDLVRDSTLDTPRVLNVVRFLLMLDADGDAGNGILISEAVRTMAAGWAPVDFAASNFATEVANIVDELTQAGTTVVLADEMVARAHLAATAACVHTGVYWVSSFSGLWGQVAVYPTEIGVIAASAVVMPREYQAPVGSVSYGDVTRVELSDAEGGTVTVEFASADHPVGRWSDGTEAFVGERVAPDHRARYRFVDYYTSACCVQALTFELDADGRAVATSSWFNWWWLPIDDHYEGRVEGDRVTLTLDGGDASFEGTLDLAAEPPSVRWTHANGSESVNYGCRLG